MEMNIATNWRSLKIYYIEKELIDETFNIFECTWLILQSLEYLDTEEFQEKNWVAEF